MPWRCIQWTKSQPTSSLSLFLYLKHTHYPEAFLFTILKTIRWLAKRLASIVICTIVKLGYIIACIIPTIHNAVVEYCTFHCNVYHNFSGIFFILMEINFSVFFFHSPPTSRPMKNTMRLRCVKFALLMDNKLRWQIFLSICSHLVNEMWLLNLHWMLHHARQMVSPMGIVLDQTNSSHVHGIHYWF